MKSTLACVIASTALFLLVRRAVRPKQKRFTRIGCFRTLLEHWEAIRSESVRRYARGWMDSTEITRFKFHLERCPRCRYSLDIELRPLSHLEKLGDVL